MKYLSDDLIWDAQAEDLQSFLEGLETHILLDLFKVCGRRTSERSRIEIQQLTTQAAQIYSNELASYDNVYLTPNKEQEVLNKFILAVNMYKEERAGNVKIITEDLRFYLYKGFEVALTKKGQSMLEKGQLQIPHSVLSLKT